MKHLIFVVVFGLLAMNGPQTAAMANEPFTEAQLNEYMASLSPLPPDLRPLTEAEIRKFTYQLRQIGAPHGSWRVTAYKEVLGILSSSFGPNHPLTGRLRYRYAAELVNSQKYDEASQQLKLAHQIFLERNAQGTPDFFWAQITKISLLDARGQHLRQLELLTRIENESEHLSRLDDNQIEELLHWKAKTYGRLGRFQEAVEVGKQHLKHLSSFLDESDPRITRALSAQALRHLDNGELEEADTLLPDPLELEGEEEYRFRFIQASVFRARGKVKEAKFDFDGANTDLQMAYEIYSGLKYRFAGAPRNGERTNHRTDIPADAENVSASTIGFEIQALAERKHSRSSFGYLGGWEPNWVRLQTNESKILSTGMIGTREVFQVSDNIHVEAARAFALKAERSTFELKKAEPFWRQILTFRMENNGEDSVVAAIARLDLANHFLLRLLPFSAEKEANLALEVLESKLGPNHPASIRGSSISALAKSKQGRIGPAKNAIDQMLPITHSAGRLVQSELLSLLIERDRLFRVEETPFRRDDFWLKWRPIVEALPPNNAFSELEKVMHASLLATRASVDLGECPDGALQATARDLSNKFRVDGPGDIGPLIPTHSQPTALITDQILVETLSCDPGGQEELKRLINEITKSQPYKFTKQDPNSYLERNDRWARMLLQDPNFGKDDQLTGLVDELTLNAASSASEQFLLMRSAALGLDARERRALGSQGVGFEQRYAYETWIKAASMKREANWGAGQPTINGPNGQATFDAEGFGPAFRAAQFLRIDANSRTQALASARAASPNPRLRNIVSEYQQFSAEIAFLDGSSNATRKRLKTLRLRHASLEAEIRNEFPRYFEFSAPLPLDEHDVRRSLDSDEGMLMITSVGQDIYVFGIAKGPTNWQAWHRVEGGAEQVEMLVSELRCDVDPLECGGNAAVQARGDDASAMDEETALQFNRQNAWELYDLLIGPVAHVFESSSASAARVDSLFVVTSGAISALPLSLLLRSQPDNNDASVTDSELLLAPWMADRFDIAYLPAVSDLMGTSKPVNANGGFIGYGAPKLGPAGDSRSVAATDLASIFQSNSDNVTTADPEKLRKLKSLPGAKEELNAVSALFPGEVRLRTAEEATETAIKGDERLSGSQVVLFATHGLLPDPSSNVAEPGLVMTPPKTASEHDDGLLTASEIAAMDFTSHLLILSACNTASEGSFSGSDSLSGLARAFVYSGAENVYASHWSVDDRATKELILVAVQISLSDPSLSKSQALTRAMIAIRTGVMRDGTKVRGWESRWSHPSFWAPFVAIAAPRKSEN